MSAPPPPPPMPKGPKPPPPLHESPLINLFKNSSMARDNNGAFVQTFKKPIESIQPDIDALLRSGVNGFSPVAFKTVQQLATVIAQAAFGNGSTTEELFRTGNAVMTLGQFMKLSPPEQLAAIDQAWNKVCTKKAFDTPIFKMDEPLDPVVRPATAPLPSGMIPDGRGGYKVGYLDATGAPRAFRKLGIGFRVDGSGANCARDIARVTSEGMTTQLKNRHLMYTIKGWEVQGTVVDRDTGAPRVWSTKKDLFNESAVCVSRNFFGATAFPTRDFDGPAVLWAVDVSGLTGFDTELYQTTLPGNKQWRPGEKAYPWIPPRNLLGYVQIERLGTGAAGGWKFRIPDNARWNFLGGRLEPAEGTKDDSEQAAAYAVAQLKAWRGEHTISGAYDFA